jgi:hypothetical protein
VEAVRLKIENGGQVSVGRGYTCHSFPMNRAPEAPCADHPVAISFVVDPEAGLLLENKPHK